MKSNLLGLPFRRSIVKNASQAVYNATAGEGFVTPDKPSLRLTGNIEFVCNLTVPTWSAGVGQIFLSKRISTGGGQACFQFGISNTNRQRAFIYGNGTTATNIQAISAPPFVNGTFYWLKYIYLPDNGSSQKELRLYSAADQVDEPTVWTHMQTVMDAGILAPFAGTDPVGIGCSGDYLANSAKTVRRAILRSGIDGTAVLDFDIRECPVNATSFRSSRTGETWFRSFLELS